MSGSMTLSWKLPDCPAIVIVVSLPITCAATIAAASGMIGLTSPGMMLLPGCSAGSAISPRRAAVHPAQIIGDLHHTHGHDLELARELDGRILRRQRLEIVAARLEADAGQSRELAAEGGGESWVRIDAGAHGGTALRQA